MSAKAIIPGGNLYLFPNSPHKRCNPQFPMRNPRISPGPLRTRAMAAVCAPAQTAPETGSFYELLGIPATGSGSEIKKAYKQLARKYHPDVSPSGCTEEYTKRFIKLKEAYETLSDPGTRALYDMDLTMGLQSNFPTRRSRGYERMEEWQRRWQTQLDELNLRGNMQRDSAGHARQGSNTTSWGARTSSRRRRNSVFDIGF